MNNIKLTIGIASIPSRMFDSKFLPKLMNNLLVQTKDRDDVEIIVLADNKKITIGKKRDRLIQMAQGEFVVLVDDDDEVVDDYVSTLCDIIKNNKNIDVISYMQECNINEEQWIVDFSLSYRQEEPLNQLQHIWETQVVKDEEGNIFYNINNETEPIEVIIGKKICERPPFPVCPFRTSLAKKFRFIDFQSAEDHAWAKQMWKECSKEYKLNKIMHIYNWSSSISELPLLDPTEAKENNEKTIN